MPHGCRLGLEWGSIVMALARWLMLNSLLVNWYIAALDGDVRPCAHLRAVGKRSRQCAF